MRPPTNLEQQVIARLLEKPFPGSDNIGRCLNGSMVSDLDEFGSLRLHPICKERAVTLATVPVEGQVLDSDGITIHVLLFVRAGLPYELQIYKDDGTRIQDKDALRRIDVFSLPAPPGPG